MKSRILTVLTFLLCLSLLTACGGGSGGNTATTEPSGDDSTEAVTTEAPAETPADQFEFEAGDKGLIVTGYHGSGKTIVIPSVVDNKKVVELNAEVFAGNIMLEEIVLSKYMTVLDLADFAGCDNLTAITYPGDITSGKSSKGPDNLTTLCLPGTKEIDLNDVIAELCEDNPNLKNLDLSGVESFESKLYPYNAGSLEGVSLTLSETMVAQLSTRKETCYGYHKWDAKILTNFCDLDYYGDEYCMMYYADAYVYCRHFESLIDDGESLYDFDIAVHISGHEEDFTYVSDSDIPSFADELNNVDISFAQLHFGSFIDRTELLQPEYVDAMKEAFTALCSSILENDDIQILAFRMLESAFSEELWVGTVRRGSIQYEVLLDQNDRSYVYIREHRGSLSENIHLSVTEYFGHVPSITINGTTYTYDWQ